MRLTAIGIAGPKRLGWKLADELRVSALILGRDTMGKQPAAGRNRPGLRSESGRADCGVQRQA